MKQIFFIILFLTQILFAQSLKISQFPSVSNTATTSSTMFLVASSGATKNLKLGELDKRWQWTATAPLSKSAGENSVLSMPSASAGSNGYLLSTDWITFNSMLSPSGVQTVTNKDIDGGTASNTNRITLPKNSKTNLDALTRKEGTLVYDNVGAKVYYDDGATLKAVGSGSGGAKNFIVGGDAESGISGFLVSKNTSAGAAPDSGFVSSGTTITFAVSSTVPLADTNSFLYTKTAANSQGQQVYVPFTIDSSSKAKVLQISFDYLVNTGTFAAGTSSTDSDVTVWIYDVTNATFIQPSSYRLLSNSSTIADKFNATFQSASNSTSYRLVFHVATTSASAFQLKVDSIAVSPSTYVYGTPKTDMVPFTGSFSAGFGTVANNNVKQYRDGDTLVLTGTFDTGTVTAAAPVITLPYTIDTNKINSTAFKHSFGRGWRNIGGGATTSLTSGSSADIDYVFTYNGTTNQIQIVRSTGSNTSGGTFINDGTSSIMGNTTTILFENVRIPIAGWSSSVQTSDQTDTRIVDFVSYKPSNEAVTANSTQIAYTAIKDSHNAWNGNQFIVPVVGDYTVIVNGSSSAGSDIIVYVNGSAVRNMMTMTSAANTSSFVIIPNLKVGDILTIRAGASVTINGSAAATTHAGLYIRRESGPSAIAATERISAKYYVSSGVSTTSANPINFDTREWDSHSACQTGAGVWRCIAPISGEYRITARNYWGATSAETYLYKNGTSVNMNVSGSISNTMGVTGVVGIKLVAGDYIELRPNTTVTPTADGALVSGTNYVIFERVGNY